MTTVLPEKGPSLTLRPGDIVDFAVLPSYAGIRPAWRNAPSGWSTSHFGTRATTTDEPNAWRSPDQIVDVYATG